MRLIDGGAFNGDSVLRFIELEPKANEILAFDPNDTFNGIWRAIEERYPQVKFYQLALSDKDGEIEYTQRPNDKPFGSTTAKDKRDWGQGSVRKVTAHDINRYITEGCILKLDVEGGEYDILERLVETGKVKDISKLYIEWHTSKMRPKQAYEQRQDKIMETLDSLGLQVVPW